MVVHSSNAGELSKLLRTIFEGVDRIGLHETAQLSFRSRETLADKIMFCRTACLATVSQQQKPGLCDSQKSVCGANGHQRVTFVDST